MDSSFVLSETTPKKLASLQLGTVGDDLNRGLLLIGNAFEEGTRSLSERKNALDSGILKLEEDRAQFNREKEELAKNKLQIEENSRIVQEQCQKRMSALLENERKMNDQLLELQRLQRITKKEKAEGESQLKSMYALEAKLEIAQTEYEAKKLALESLVTSSLQRQDIAFKLVDNTCKQLDFIRERESLLEEREKRLLLGKDGSVLLSENSEKLKANKANLLELRSYEKDAKDMNSRLKVYQRGADDESETKNEDGNEDDDATKSDAEKNDGGDEVSVDEEKDVVDDAIIKKEIKKKTKSDAEEEMEKEDGDEDKADEKKDGDEDKADEKKDGDEDKADEKKDGDEDKADEKKDAIDDEMKSKKEVKKTAESDTEESDVKNDKGTKSENKADEMEKNDGEDRADEEKRTVDDGEKEVKKTTKSETEESNAKNDKEKTKSEDKTDEMEKNDGDEEKDDGITQRDEINKGEIGKSSQQIREAENEIRRKRIETEQQEAHTILALANSIKQSLDLSPEDIRIVDRHFESLKTVDAMTTAGIESLKKDLDLTPDEALIFNEQMHVFVESFVKKHLLQSKPDEVLTLDGSDIAAIRAKALLACTNHNKNKSGNKIQSLETLMLQQWPQNNNNIEKQIQVSIPQSDILVKGKSRIKACAFCGEAIDTGEPRCSVLGCDRHRLHFKCYAVYCCNSTSNDKCPGYFCHKETCSNVVGGIDNKRMRLTSSSND
jgi:hypothetical protein